MDDVRHFLRYISPGILFLLEAWGLVFCFAPSSALEALGAVKEDSGIGSLLTLLVASGALGYVFSQIHHSRAWGNSRDKIDFSAPVNALIESGALAVINLERGGVASTVSAVTKHEAWVVLSAYWHPRTGEDGPLHAAAKRADSLVDIAHGAGTALIASVTAALVAFGILLHLAFGTSQGVHLSPGAFLGTLLFFLVFHLHTTSYRTTSTLACETISSMFMSAVMSTVLAKDGEYPLVVGTAFTASNNRMKLTGRGHRFV